MGKNAYLVITDLHFGNFVTSSRTDYRKEVSLVKHKLLEIAIKYKKQGYCVKALLLGDIFHSGYRDVTDALTDANFIELLKQSIGDVYSVVGNHELTYYRANPFYTMISSINSKRLQSVTDKVWQPLGMANTINVVDELKDGEVTFFFNHYGTGVQSAEMVDGVKIGLFHQELVDNQIVDEMKRSGTKYFGKPMALEESGTLDGYDYCFFGHLHTVYGIWKSKETFLYYLGSLGRTNETEVSDNFLERNVPVVLVEDGVFKGVQDNLFQLMQRGDCISEDRVAENRIKSQKTKAVKQLREYTPISDDPIVNVKAQFCEEPLVLTVIQDLLVKDEDCRIISLKRKLRKLGIGNKRNQG